MVVVMVLHRPDTREIYLSRIVLFNGGDGTILVKSQP